MRLDAGAHRGDHPVSTDLTPQKPGASPTFEAVFHDNVTFVWRALRRFGVREADLPDVCQEVFLVVYRKLPRFQGRSQVRTWLYGICIRSMSEYRRRSRRHREEAWGDDLSELCTPPAQEQELERRRALERLDAALDKLDDKKRVVFVLHAIEEIPMTEVAAAVGCPLQTAYSRLHAAWKIIEAEVQREEEPIILAAGQLGRSSV